MIIATECELRLPCRLFLELNELLPRDFLDLDPILDPNLDPILDPILDLEPKLLFFDFEPIPLLFDLDDLDDLPLDLGILILFIVLDPMNYSFRFNFYKTILRTI